MPPKRRVRKFESTFPAARIKKIMQLDDDVGRVAASVPIVISRAVEMFLQAMLKKASHIASSRNAKTLTVGHLKYCIEQEKQWDFLKDLTAKVPDITAGEEMEESPKRGRKRKTSSSKAPPSSSAAKKKAKKVENSDEEDEETDTSSPESSTSHTSLPKTKQTDPSPLSLLQQSLNPSSTSPAVSSPLLAFTSSLKSGQGSAKSNVPNVAKGNTSLTGSSIGQSPLAALAASISGKGPSLPAGDDDDDYDV